MKPKVQIKNINKRNIWVILGVVLFVLQPLILPSKAGDFSQPWYFADISRNILGNALILLFFGINYFYLIPKLLFTKKYLEYGLCMFFGLLAVVMLPRSIFPQPFGPPPMMGPPPHMQQEGFFSHLQLVFSEVDHLVFLFIGMVFFSTFWFERMRNERIEREKLKAELSHLKMQIHPHFLFNTLNSIYASAIKKEDKTSEMVLVLSDFMRYLLQDSYQNQVLLEREVSYIENYVRLQTSRLRETVTISFTQNGDFSGLLISPLILFTFVENAFKYGVNPDQHSEIIIDISQENGILDFHCFNRIVNSENTESSNIGLKNTKERLSIFYPQKHNLDIQQDQQTFVVHLKIHLV
ncbi:MAG: hypothetical protein C4K58_06555 [Flavobacteriaceae bacterium]|nr:MAG: hypothetical protein C4K58_06555 [Flavobacteriaceae bacterium]